MSKQKDPGISFDVDTEESDEVPSDDNVRIGDVDSSADSGVDELRQAMDETIQNWLNAPQQGPDDMENIGRCSDAILALVWDAIHGI